MPRILISLAALATLTFGAHAQSPAPAAPKTDGPAQPQAKTDEAMPGASDAAQAKASGNGNATEWTYKTKDGQMYQPPEQRPASPAMDLSVYGRT